jgi:putative addiction module component (TIGR02574 family)
MTAKTILEQALRLPREERLKIAEQLVDSALDQQALSAGAAIAEARWQAFRAGEIGAKSVDEAMDNLRKHRRKKS